MEPDARQACDRLIERLERAERLGADPDEESLRGEGRLAEPLLRYAIALLRMRIRPALEPGWLERDPVHVSLFGGTNTGKSTLLNLLLGRAAAGMDVTARFSQHPEGYRLRSLGQAWLDEFPSRFDGFARHLDEHPPRQSDAELTAEGYRPALALLDPLREITSAPSAPVATTAVLWDVPDFSTEQAMLWLGAILDTVALADIVILVVTDESYADERGSTLLALVSATGVSMHVVANRVGEEEGLLADIRAKIDRHWRGAGDALPSPRFHRLGFVEGDDPLSRLARLLESEEAGRIRRAIGEEVSRGLALKRANLAGSVRFLEARLEEMLRPIARETRIAVRWSDLVRRTTDREFLDRYRSDYLHGERYGEFNRTLVRLMDLLEVPGIGEIVKMLSRVVRIPVTILTGMVRRIFGWSKREPAHSPEHEVLATRFAAWIARIRAEAQERASASGHARWRKIAAVLDDEEFLGAMTDRLEEAYAEYRPEVERAVEERAREIHAAIEKRPLLLNTLRSANLAVDTAAIFLVVKSGGLNWSDAIVGPVVAGLRRTLFEAGMEQYLAHEENLLKRKQYEAMEAIVRSRLEEPVRRLFVAEFEPGEVRAVRKEYDTVKRAALAVAGAQGGGA